MYLYLVITNNGDTFQTSDIPEETYKEPLAFGGWSAFRYDTSTTQPYEEIHYDGEGFYWEPCNIL